MKVNVSRNKKHNHMFAPSPKSLDASRHGRQDLHKAQVKSLPYDSRANSGHRIAVDRSSVSRFSQNNYSTENPRKYEPSNFSINKIASNLGKLC